MPRKSPTIHVEVVENLTEATEADLRRWVRATRILLRAKARRDARVAALASEKAIAGPEVVEVRCPDEA